MNSHKTPNTPTIKKIQSNKMNCKYRCLVIFVCINVVFAITSAILWKMAGLLNFEVGFFSFLIVLYSTYVSVQKKLKKELQNTAQDTQESAQDTDMANSESKDEQNPDDKKSKPRFSFSNLILGMQLSMGIFRIIAYVILVIGVVFLMGKNIFLAIPYILGIMICLTSVITLKYLSSRAEK